MSSRREVFEVPLLARAIARSFQARDTPAVETVLTPEFMQDEVLAGRWRAYLRRTKLSAEPDFVQLVSELAVFLPPVSES